MYRISNAEFVYICNYTLIDNIINNKEHYIQWLLNQCLKKDIKPEHVMTKEAIKLLADRLVTPLQITHYLQKAIEQAYLVGEKPVTYDIIEQIYYQI